jgi:hypothetical protein
MNYLLVENLTRRPVSVICNSGKSYHLPPRSLLKFMDVEISNNAMLEKLKQRHVLSVKEFVDNPPDSGAAKKTKSKKDPE